MFPRSLRLQKTFCYSSLLIVITLIPTIIQEEDYVRRQGRYNAGFQEDMNDRVASCEYDDEIPAYLFGDKYFEKAEAILATDFIYYKAFISN